MNDGMGVFEVLQTIFAGIVLLFLPGFVWSYTLFKRHQMDSIERTVLSVGASIVLVPLTSFVLNYVLDVQINLTNLLITSLVWTMIPLVYFLLKKLLKKTETKT